MKYCKEIGSIEPLGCALPTCLKCPSAQAFRLFLQVSVGLSFGLLLRSLWAIRGHVVAFVGIFA